MADSTPVPSSDPRPSTPASDPLTLAAARDTGMPGFRIVATAPPESALPPLPPEELARRRHRPLRVQVLWWVGWSITGAAMRLQVNRLEPRLIGAHLPLIEEAAWIAFSVGAATLIWMAIWWAASAVWRRLRPPQPPEQPSIAEVLQRAADRPGGASVDPIVDAVGSGRDRD